MRYVPQRVNRHTIHSFELDNVDYNKYTGQLRGFTHSTNTFGFGQIIASQTLMSSYLIRANQRIQGTHQTGGDRGHDGQYTVYFRFVEHKHNVNLLSAILNSRGSVGSSGSAIFFFPFTQAVQHRKCFSLAGGIDGLHGTNCFKSDDAMIADKKFWCGLDAAISNSRTNEIGFYGTVPINYIEVILFRSKVERNVVGFTWQGLYKDEWSVYTNNNLPRSPLPPLQLRR